MTGQTDAIAYEHRVEGLTYAEIAREMGCTPKTALARVRRHVAALRRASYAERHPTVSSPRSS